MRRLALILSLLAGCAVQHAYEGPNRPASETALFLAKTFTFEIDTGRRGPLGRKRPLRVHVQVHAIDEYALDAERVYVLPGTRAVWIRWVKFYGRPPDGDPFTKLRHVISGEFERVDDGRIRMPVEARAGHEYTFVVTASEFGPPRVRVRSKPAR